MIQKNIVILKNTVLFRLIELNQNCIGVVLPNLWKFSCFMVPSTQTTVGKLFWVFGILAEYLTVVKHIWCPSFKKSWHLCSENLSDIQLFQRQQGQCYASGGFPTGLCLSTIPDIFGYRPSSFQPYFFL